MKPVKPDESDCCGSGCKPCVFDVYEERLRKWKLVQENVTQSKALDQIKYLPFVITDIQSLEDHIKVFKFQAVTLLKESKCYIESAQLGIDFEVLIEPLNIKSGEYLILKGVSKGDTISRSYTPVLNQDDFEKGTFQVIISLQKNGKMSDFFLKLKPNDIVFWRGPFSEFQRDIKSFQQILLIGGGTGIVPLYNIAKTIVEDEEYEIWVNVFASFKTVGGIILRRELGRLRDFWNFQMNVYITGEKPLDFVGNHNESVIFKKIDETVIEEEVNSCKKGELLAVVCGPEGFNRFVENCLGKVGVKKENIFVFW